LDIKVGTVRFDGCRRSNGFLLEAKANYVRFLGRDGQWKTFFLNTGAAQLKKQLLRQSGAAALVGREVEWHVLQKPVADKLREIVRLLKIGNIEVIFDPGPWP
jgi:sugar/nucleoside kinase (ribokinase family)